MVTPQEEHLQEKILERFLSEDSVRLCIDLLASASHPIRRNELFAYLHSIHLFAFSCICDEYDSRGTPILIPDALPRLRKCAIMALAQAVKQMSHVWRNVDKLGENIGRKLDAFYSSFGFLASQMRLIHQYGGSIDSSLQNRNFVLLRFSEQYVEELQKLVFPPWYTACFIDDCQDASVWGHYGDGHKGVCLKFRAKSNGNTPVINLNGVGHPFHKINYTNDYITVEFFKKIGRLSAAALRKHWYCDRNGNKSPIGNEVLSSVEEWRAGYWEDFFRSANSKLPAWSYEREYRLILTDELFDLSAAENRKKRYDFADLEGIIFGMRTPETEKLEIIRIVDQKCAAVGRTDFKFYQASYLPQSGKIEPVEMGLVKLK